MLFPNVFTEIKPVQFSSIVPVTGPGPNHSSWLNPLNEFNELSRSVIVIVVKIDAFVKLPTSLLLSQESK